MALFSVQGGNVKKVPPIKVGLEKDIQKLFESNLKEILDITFLKSEYSTSSSGRIDTLGIDNNGAPAIIEYKRTHNSSVINQGISYLRWLLDHKADFELLVREAKVNIKIDWASPRVICVAESYNKFDLDTAELLPIRIELLKYRIYQNNVLLVDLETPQKTRIPTSGVFEKSKKEKVTKKKEKYTLKDHLSKTNQKGRQIFEALNEKIIELDESIIVEPKALYIAYKLVTNFADVVIMKKYALKIFLNMPSGELNDPDGIARDLTKPKKGHWGNGDYEIKLKAEEQIDKVFDLIKQSYIYNK